ncbi:hypothetical protein AWC38_SpisGene23073 [Stylophora pistillata]|uniref:Uncharacterized protein n=1 Tax=Stylophora pistillata TaxID=50429 RepID=A0A2B4R3H6_STYPI|nr:hypothetical protein AWC38_SpisGene23073 [Stylophora pistillata]
MLHCVETVVSVCLRGNMSKEYVKRVPFGVTWNDAHVHCKFFGGSTKPMDYPCLREKAKLVADEIEEAVENLSRFEQLAGTSGSVLSLKDGKLMDDSSSIFKEAKGSFTFVTKDGVKRKFVEVVNEKIADEGCPPSVCEVSTAADASSPQSKVGAEVTAKESFHKEFFKRKVKLARLEACEAVQECLIAQLDYLRDSVSKEHISMNMASASDKPTDGWRLEDIAIDKSMYRDMHDIDIVPRLGAVLVAKPAMVECRDEDWHRHMTAYPNERLKSVAAEILKMSVRMLSVSKRKLSSPYKPNGDTSLWWEDETRFRLLQRAAYLVAVRELAAFAALVVVGMPVELKDKMVEWLCTSGHLKFFACVQNTVHMFTEPGCQGVLDTLMHDDCNAIAWCSPMSLELKAYKDSWVERHRWTKYRVSKDPDSQRVNMSVVEVKETSQAPPQSQTTRGGDDQLMQMHWQLYQQGQEIQDKVKDDEEEVDEDGVAFVNVRVNMNAMFYKFVHPLNPRLYYVKEVSDKGKWVRIALSNFHNDRYMREESGYAHPVHSDDYNLPVDVVGGEPWFYFRHMPNKLAYLIHFLSDNPEVVEAVRNGRDQYPCVHSQALSARKMSIAMDVREWKVAQPNLAQIVLKEIVEHYI